VAKELPERIEEDLSITMEGVQLRLYQAELKRARAHLLKAKLPSQLDKMRFHILTSLLRLRQICCHTALLGIEANDAPAQVSKARKKAKKIVDLDSGASAKLEALMDLLEPIMEEGQKILVFSQFVDMLEIIRRSVDERGWKNFTLTGKTEDRGDLVDDFQSTEGSAIFLISLKAGGSGLNLTAASYVVIFDPWWNPAVEAQAIDRTHRIGQKRTVIAYRLVVQNSIEQKIRDLQKQKSNLANDILGEESFARSLTLDDFNFLLGSNDD
jgi:SNF2 family DNA or RNA helicase